MRKKAHVWFSMVFLSTPAKSEEKSSELLLISNFFGWFVVNVVKFRTRINLFKITSPTSCVLIIYFHKISSLPEEWNSDPFCLLYLPEFLVTKENLYRWLSAYSLSPSGQTFCCWPAVALGVHWADLYLVCHVHRRYSHWYSESGHQEPGGSCRSHR